jgi:hypothetical protein
MSRNERKEGRKGREGKKIEIINICWFKPLNLGRTCYAA